VPAGSVLAVPTATLDLHRVAQERLGADNQRYTTKRRQLVDLLAGAVRPLTIPEILTAQPGLAQSSVYRNLTVLQDAGVVQRIVTNDEWGRFELAEDLTEHHHHLICSQCGVVSDFTLSARMERSLEGALVAVAADNGFAAEHHRLDIVGVCRDCGRMRR
jgi:Fur family transcriptional regulator, ferric uptake regulator